MPNYTTSYSTKKKPRARRRPATGYQLPAGRQRATRRRGATYLNHSQGFGRRRGFNASGGNARKPYAIIVVACAALFFVASIIWYMNRGVAITLNDAEVSVRINSTIEQLIADQGLDESTEAGDLLAVDDSVLERQGGARYTITLDGEDVALDDIGSVTLTGGETVTVEDGPDTYEEHDVVATDIAPTLTVKGTGGAITYVETWGEPGRSEVWTGKTSGITQDRGVVKEVVNCVLNSSSVSPDEGNYLALTFDEGPSSYTREIVQILQDKGVGATFFLQGDMVEANPDAAKAIADAGFESGSNSYQDENLTKLEGDSLRSALTRGFDAIETATGKRVSLLRAPYAAFSEENWAQAMDLVSAVVTWNVDSGDWLLQGAGSVVETVTSSVRNGNIILLSDNEATGAQTVETLPTLIDRLQEAGYTLVSVSDLISTDERLSELVDVSRVSMPDGAVLPTVASDGGTE